MCVSIIRHNVIIITLGSGSLWSQLTKPNYNLEVSEVSTKGKIQEKAHILLLGQGWIRREHQISVYLCANTLYRLKYTCICLVLRCDKVNEELSSDFNTYTCVHAY